MSQLSIKTKLISLIVLPIIGFMVVLFEAQSELKSAKLGVDRIYKDRVVPLEDLKVIADDYAVLVIDAINKANAGLVTSEQAQQNIRAAVAEIDGKWQKYMATELTEEEARLAGEAQGLFDLANGAIDQALNVLSGVKGNAAGQLNTIDGPLYKSIDPISEKITELVALQLRVASEENQLIEEGYVRNSTIMFTLVGSLILILVIGGWWIYRSMMGPLRDMQKTIEQISTNSDLTLHVEAQGGEELSAISNSFNQMIGHMREMIGQISSAAGRLSSAASELNAVSEGTNLSIQSQQREIEQVATAMNEMVSTAQHISSNADQADQEAKHTSEQAQIGNNIVAEAVSSTNALVEDVKNVSQHIENLKNDSENIGSVVDVIRGIAEQTNLLALNAAIEAARAGDQGRGFAVVADEVRTLAQRTQVSTQEIQDAIEHLQTGTTKAVEAMESGQQRAEIAGNKAVEAGEALQKIAEAVEGITQRNAQIALASEQQTGVSDEVNRSLVNINDTSTTSSQDAERLSTESESLSDLSQDLDRAVRQFKI